MTLTPVAVKAAFFAVAKTGVSTESVALRAALGAGANSVLYAEDVSVATLPSLASGCFIALRWLSDGGARYQPQKYYPVWWLYDALPQRWDRINALLPLLRVAYPLNALSYCEVDYTLATSEITDDKLNLRARSQPFIIGNR